MKGCAIKVWLSIQNAILTWLTAVQFPGPCITSLCFLLPNGNLETGEDVFTPLNKNNATSHPKLPAPARRNTKWCSCEHYIHRQETQTENLMNTDCGAWTSQEIMLPFELMVFPLANKETEATGLRDMPKMMKEVSPRAGNEGILVPSSWPYVVFLGGDIVVCIVL